LPDIHFFAVNYRRCACLMISSGMPILPCICSAGCTVSSGDLKEVGDEHRQESRQQNNLSLQLQAWLVKHPATSDEANAVRKWLASPG